MWEWNLKNIGSSTLSKSISGIRKLTGLNKSNTFVQPKFIKLVKLILMLKKKKS